MTHKQRLFLYYPSLQNVQLRNNMSRNMEGKLAYTTNEGGGWGG